VKGRRFPLDRVSQEKFGYLIDVSERFATDEQNRNGG
jgi:hypothetical protein